MRHLPLWIPDSLEGDGWILNFPDGLNICYLEDQESPATIYDTYLETYELKPRDP